MGMRRGSICLFWKYMEFENSPKQLSLRVLSPDNTKILHDNAESNKPIMFAMIFTDWCCQGNLQFRIPLSALTYTHYALSTTLHAPF